MVHSTFLIDLRLETSVHLTFVPKNVPDYQGPVDDIIAFAVSAERNSIPLHICNEEIYGYIMVPLEDGMQLQDDYGQMTNLKLEVLVESPPLPVDPVLSEYTWRHSHPDTLGFDAAFLINLERRPERRQRMTESFRELGIKSSFVGAVDGLKLNQSLLDEMGIKMLPEYMDPYHKRPLTYGEIGCFLSHYNIWREMVVRGLQTAIVFEDDIRFEPYFRHKIQTLMQEIASLQLDWDLIYLGRKRLKDVYEPWVDGSKQLVWVDYSYWTLCYIISLQGAKKLLAGDPLDKMVPVDEYLPIMFDRHPEETWKAHYPVRDLKAFSVAPLLVYPTHYTGENGYVSDTEESVLLYEGGQGMKCQHSSLSDCQPQGPPRGQDGPPEQRPAHAIDPHAKEEL